MNDKERITEVLAVMDFECLSTPESDKQVYIKDNISILISKRG